MRKLAWSSLPAVAIGLMLYALGCTPAAAQTQVRPCYDTGVAGAPCQSTGTATPLPVTGTVTVTPTNPVGITPTDKTITSASGASQTLAAANTARHSLTVVNTGNANCGVNPTGGTAAIGGAGTITLSPLGAYTPRIPTLSAVTVICTAGQPIYGDEN